MPPWQTQMDALRARTREPGLADPGRAAAMSGLAFLRAMIAGEVPEIGPVRADGKVVAGGKRTATAEGRLVDADGRLYSHGTTTCLLYDL